MTRPARPYWFYRLYAGIVGLTWNSVGFWGMSRNEAPILMLFLFPFILPVIFMTLSAGAFRISYSAFGPRPRTPWPASPIETASGTGGRVGWASATIPFVTWAVFREGIGFKMSGIGTGFVPFSCVIQVKKQLLGCKIIHSSPEIRSPLSIPSRKLCRAIETVFGSIDV